MRSLVILSVATGWLLACGNTTGPARHPEAESKGAAAIPATAPCPDALPEALHLGDGTTSYNYYFIAEELARRPGSETLTRETLQRQKEAEQSSGMNVLKPPSANVVETEFSHLLGAVMQSNGGGGVAVFDTHGLKVGAAGLQLEAMLLPKARMSAIMRVGADDPPAVQRRGDTVGYYRPVFGVNGNAIGISTIVTKQLPHCQAK